MKLGVWVFSLLILLFSFYLLSFLLPFLLAFIFFSIVFAWGSRIYHTYKYKQREKYCTASRKKQDSPEIIDVEYEIIDND